MLAEVITPTAERTRINAILLKGVSPVRWVMLLAAVLTIGFSVHSHGEIVYKYKDKNGRTVFSDIPRSTSYTKIEVNPKGWSDPSKSLGLPIIKTRMKKYDHLVEMACGEYDLPVSLVNAVIAAESAFVPKAVSSAGAMGLMQLMPATARRFGVKDAFVPEDNIRGGVKYLNFLMDKFNGNLNLVLAAYNAGEGAVQKYGNAIPPYPETQNYVRKVKRFNHLLNTTSKPLLAQSG